MPSSLADLRAEFATALSGLDERIYPHPPAVPEMPCIIVGFPTRIEFDQTLTGRARYELVLTVLVSMADVEAAEAELDTILTGSFRSELYDHVTTVWREFHVDSVTNIRPESVGSSTALAADINITLIA